MSKRNAELQAQHLQLAADVIANLSDAQIDDLALIYTHAFMAGKTPQEATVYANSYLDLVVEEYLARRQPDPIPEPGPADPGKEVAR